MAVAFDAATPASGTNSSFTFSHTCTGTNRALAVTVDLRGTSGTTCTGITYNGVAMTQVITADNSDATRRVYIFRLVAPATGANNVVVSLSASEPCIMSAVSATNVDQTTPVSNTASATGASGTATVNCTSANGELVIDALCSVDTGNAWTAGAGQTATVNTLVSTTRGAASYEAATGTPVTMSWTTAGSDRWVIAAISFKEAAGAGPVIPVFMNQYRQRRA